MSPLQSLMVLHGGAGDPSARYIHHIQQAIRVLYGSATPSEVFQSSQLRLETLDLNEFLTHVAANAQDAGVAGVRFIGGNTNSAKVRADEYSLEDVLAHLLSNADRHRTSGSEITIALDVNERRREYACTTLANRSRPSCLIAFSSTAFPTQRRTAAAMTPAQRAARACSWRGPMAKWGTVTARNEDGGVTFELVFPMARA